VTRTRPFPKSLLGPVLAACAGAWAVPGFPPFAAAVVAVAALVRLVALRQGREIDAPRTWTVLWASGPAIATAYVSAVARSGGEAGPALLAAGALAVAVGLVAPSTPAGWARLLGLAGLLVAGSCLAAPRGPAVLAAIAFVVLLVPAALAFGEAPPSSSAAGSEGLVRRVRSVRAIPSPWRAHATAVAVLLLLGLPGGLLFFGALPAKPPTASGTGKRGGGIRPATFAGEPASADDVRDVGPTALARSGLPRNLRENAGVVLTVRVGAGEESSEVLWLRGQTYDRFDGREWSRSAAADVSELAPSDPLRPGWVVVSPEVDPTTAPMWRVRAIDIDGRGARTALWVLPGATRIHLDARAGGLAVRRAADGVIRVGPPEEWSRGDAYETAGPYTGLDRAGLTGLASDARVSPSQSDVAAPPDERVLKEAALAAVGSATTAAERAARLEAWLRAPPFAYEPVEEAPDPKRLEIDRRRPVSDFLLRVRRGRCWSFASAMTLMMRALGHPARFASGLRGGEYVKSSKTYDFRGTDSHAWCEVWYAGRGWVIYDPTPPSGEPRSDEAGASAADDSESGSSFWEKITGDSAEERRKGIDRVVRSLRTAGRSIVSAGPWLLSGVAIVLGLLVAAVARRRRARAAIVARTDSDAAARPLRGPYARALSALAGFGVPRRACETPVEYGLRAVAAIPEVGDPLAVLTADHDLERYGGATPDSEAQRRDEAAAQFVADVARRPRTLT
jgi:hypothetical protein